MTSESWCITRMLCSFRHLQVCMLFRVSKAPIPYLHLTLVMSIARPESSISAPFFLCTCDLAVGSMASRTLTEALDAQFDKIAVQLDDEAERVLYKPGVEGLHLLLDGCCAEACDACMRADTISTSSLRRIFDDRSWGPDTSFTRDELLALVRMLRNAEPENDMDSILNSRPSTTSNNAKQKTEHRSAIDILETLEEGCRCNFEGELVACDLFPREVSYGETSLGKRKKSLSSGRTADIVLADRTGPIIGSVWDATAEELCQIWRSSEERRHQGHKRPCVVELLTVRVRTPAPNKWNGTSVTRIRTLSSIKETGDHPGTQVRALKRPTSPHLTTTEFRVPPSACCVTVFDSLSKKLTPPFRLSVRGTIVDLRDAVKSERGNCKRRFDIVDHEGVYISCCAMAHNVHSPALRNFEDVILYYGTGRGAVGRDGCKLYLFKDAMVFPAGGPRQLDASKTRELTF